MIVHVGIVTYNSAADLPACIAALRGQTYPDLAIQIVDNASSDETRAWLAANAPDLPLIANAENVGFGRAHNQIMRAVGAADAYLCLNPDAELAPDYIEKLVAVLSDDEEHPIGSAVGKLLMDGGMRIYSAGHAITRTGYTFNIGYGMDDAPIFNARRMVFGASGAAALYRGKMLADLRSESGAIFDPDIFLYAEDTDLDWRAQRRGWACAYVPSALAYHRGTARGTFGRESAHNHLILGNRYLSAIKNADRFTLWTGVLPTLIVHLGARLILTPRFGLKLLRCIVPRLPRWWRKRRIEGRARRVSTRTLHAWHRWAREQPGAPRGR
jgi:GT2 family glycosyltransferase